LPKGDTSQLGRGAFSAFSRPNGYQRIGLHIGTNGPYPFPELFVKRRKGRGISPFRKRIREEFGEPLCPI